MLKNTDSAYGLITRIFHWVIALAIIGLLSVGFVMSSMPASKEKFELYDIHKATGVIVLALVALRILWRSINKAVQPPAGLPYILKLGAKTGHFLLYIFMLLMPISGILMSRFAGYDISVFNLFTIPALEKNQQLAGIFHTIHGTAAWGLVIVIVLHILAAFYHHFIRKDKVLMRMIKQSD